MVHGCQPHQDLGFEENGRLGRFGFTTGMEAEEGEGGDDGPQQDSGVKDYQLDEERLLIMAPFAKAFNFTFDDLGDDEASGVQLDPAMEEEEVLFVNSDDSVDNGDGGNEVRVNEDNEVDFVHQSSPDEVLFINVSMEDVSDARRADEHHVQTKTTFTEILFPDVKADNGFKDTTGNGEDKEDHDEEGVEQVHVGVEVGEDEGPGKGLDAPGIKMVKYQNQILLTCFR